MRHEEINSLITNYLATTFTEKKLECYSNELSYFHYDFGVKWY